MSEPTIDDQTQQQAQQQQASSPEDNSVWSFRSDDNNTNGDTTTTSSTNRREGNGRRRRRIAQDDGAEDDDEFDLVEEPCLVVNSVTVNQTGTRIAIAHSRGVIVSSVYSASSSSSSSPSDQRPPSSSSSAMVGVKPTTVFEITSEDLNKNNNTKRLDDQGELVLQHSTSSSAARKGGVGIAALLFETQVVAVVGGGIDPCEPPNRVLLYSGKHLLQRLQMLGAVSRVILDHDRVVTLSYSTLTLHSFKGEKLHEFPAVGWIQSSVSLTPPSTATPASEATAASGGMTSVLTSWVWGSGGASDKPSSTTTSGAQQPSTSTTQLMRRMPLALSHDSSVCAYPDASGTGHVALCNIRNGQSIATHIHAHNGAIASIAVSPDGSAFATISMTASVVRVWDVQSGNKMAELRIHSSYATASTMVHYLAFCHNPSTPSSTSTSSQNKGSGGGKSDYLALLDSGSGRLKFFYVGDEEEAKRQSAANTSTALVKNKDDAHTGAAPAKNQGSRFTSLSFVSSYFASQWHCAEMDVPNWHKGPEEQLKSANITSSSAEANNNKLTRTSSSSPSSSPPLGSVKNSSATTDGITDQCVLRDSGVMWFESPVIQQRNRAGSASSTTTTAATTTKTPRGGSKQDANNSSSFDHRIVCIKADGTTSFATKVAFATLPDGKAEISIETQERFAV